MGKNKLRPPIVRILLVSFFIIISCRTDLAQAFTPGKTYDSKNWQEIDDISPHFLVNWVKRGDFIMGTGHLNFEFELEKAFLEACNENHGKFDINEEGFIVDKEARKPPKFIYGLPFPQIDAQDPKAGERIMANFQYAKMRVGGYIMAGRTSWIGKRGSEREMVDIHKYIYYQGRPGGPVQNNDNFLYQTMMNVIEPMDSKDVVMMTWRYNDRRLDTSFNYVSALRRFKRTSPTARSEAMFGTDMSKDDTQLWSGKNSAFNWRLIGDKKVLCAFTSPNRVFVKDMPDGTVQSKLFPIKLGYSDPNWKGTPWAPVNLTWSPRPVWLVEGVPKDPNYNYGKILFYVDKATFSFWYKEIYDRSGQYLKAMLAIQSFQVAPSERTNLLHLDGYIAVDDSTRHATYYCDVVAGSGLNNALYCPESMLGPQDFNTNVVQQLSK